MEKHHQDAIDVFLKRYQNDETILAILLGGSIAHGFAKPDSDIDVALIVEPAEFQKRKLEGKLAFSIWDICTYEHGYVDCKVLDIDMLHTIAQKGSDASRYAFKDTRVLYSKISELDDLLSQIDRYPVEQKDERRNRFASQVLAWKWYYSEGVKKNNPYLLNLALQKIVLFSSRIVLNENEMLFPYHKWMLRVLETATRKPDALMEKINALYSSHTQDSVNAFCAEIFSFISFTEQTVDWPNYFLKDSEQNWIDHEAPVDDL